MDVEARQAFGQYIGIGLGAEHAAAAVQHPHFAVQRLVPAALLHARGQHAVEQCGTGSRQQQRTLVLAHATATEHRQGRRHVAAVAAEALLTEPVRQAALGNLLQAFADRCTIPLHVAQHQLEAVAGQCAALQLAVVPGGVEHFDLITGQRGEIRRDAFGQVHAEALGGQPTPPAAWPRARYWHRACGCAAAGARLHPWPRRPAVRRPGNRPAWCGCVR
ncbi:hypothetical protein G6F24_015449 [Rhizopus arrhizus]|nr:hypothetical protein G6F24_015449 [Rhizopus arrhizus]